MCHRLEIMVFKRSLRCHGFLCWFYIHIFILKSTACSCEAMVLERGNQLSRLILIQCDVNCRLLRRWDGLDIVTFWWRLFKLRFTLWQPRFPHALLVHVLAYFLCSSWTLNWSLWNIIGHDMQARIRILLHWVITLSRLLLHLEGTYKLARRLSVR